MKYTFNLDDHFDGLWYELERIQDGGNGHIIAMNGDTPEMAAKALLDRLMPFFSERFEEVEDKPDD